MKKYVFITMNISNVGGAEQYIYNKSRFLEKNGYEVFVFSSLNREIIIDGLKKYTPFIMPQLMYAPYTFKMKEIENVIASIISVIDTSEDDDIFIESNSVCAAMWGEYLAEKLNACNVILNLQEKHNYSKKAKEYLEFKLSRKELSGITPDSISLMLEKEVEYEPWMSFHAYCINVVDNIPNKFDSLIRKDADYVLGSIGRLEKECVTNIVNTFFQFAVKNPLKKIDVVFIGGSADKNVIQNIRDHFQNAQNVNLIITGFLYPIPRELLQKVSLFVSTAGSSKVSYNEKRPTVQVHPITGEPVQIMGYTYLDNSKHSMYETLEDTSLLEQISLALTLAEMRFDGPDPQEYVDRMEAGFKSQLLYFDREKHSYFGTLRIRPRLSIKTALYVVVGRIFGGKVLQKILEKYRRV